MVLVSTLNEKECWRSQALLEPNFLAEYSDIEVVAGSVLFPAHRAVLAAHSVRFRSTFESERNERSDLSFSSVATDKINIDVGSTSNSNSDEVFQYIRQPRRQFMLEVSQCSDDTLRCGWDIIYRYCYGIKVPLDTHAALAAVQVAKEYRFDELAIVLDAYLRGGGVNPAKCTEVFSAAVEASRKSAAHTSVSSSISSTSNNTSTKNEADVIHSVKTAAWRVMKERFSVVSDWKYLPYSYMIRLIKLNDLHVSSEIQVWRAVAEWITACATREDVAVVNGLVKLVRFPTMTKDELTEVQASPVLAMYPGVTRFVARRRVNSDSLLDCSPVFRTRRMDALTFSDKIPAWSTLTKAVHTSTRYFAGALWRIVVDPTSEAVGLYLSVISEESHGEVDVSFDFSLFLVHHEADENGANILVRKQANSVRFTRSGQRAGFANVVARSRLEENDCPLVRNDTLCIGASIRLRGKKNVDKNNNINNNNITSSKARDSVPGISAGADDTAEMVTF